jgi:hypothetical protein
MFVLRVPIWFDTVDIHCITVVFATVLAINSTVVVR